ncbi:branched-chain amino acid ABC transporter permease [Ferrovibrio sp.]|uniref:branched-chain amino acid ABC transporter permease n=1 Tax=Ferrovibrio sp. TaxID=1917215 RepID=UPI001BC4C6E0|nr:branched-chain amino acid ABC transporter permease [Alphaproteobacteria bacterium]
MKSANSSLRRNFIRLGLLVVGIAVLDVALTSQFYRSTLTLSLIFAIAAVGLTLLMGFAGQVSIGQGAFFGLGAYSAAFAIQQLGIPPLVGLVVAAVVPGFFGYLIARPILRLSGNNLALATLALAAVFYVVATQWSSVTGGIDPGITGLPALDYFGLSHIHVVLWLAGICLVICTAVALLLIDGRFGRALMAIKTSEVVASCTGVDVARTKAIAFAIAAAYAGIAGALFGYFLRAFNATSFNVGLSIELLMMVIVGSLSTVWGAIFGALAIMVLPNLLEGFDHAKLLVYGLAMVAIMMLAPNGLGETLAKLVTRRRVAE